MNRTGAVLLLTASLLFAACSGSPGNANIASSAPTPAAASPSPLTEFEKDLQFIRNGQYTYVWIFSRKDGKPLDSSDGNFLRTNAPQVVDWVKTNEGRKIIGGTNFNLEEGNLEAIKKRFIAEDYSGK